MYNKKIKKIILEGFWGSGKTTLANILKREEKFLFIKEPNHSTEKKGSINIDNWYIKKHQLNFKHLINSNIPTVMERSLFSSAAWLWSNNKKTIAQKTIKQCLFFYNKCNPIIIFLYNKKNNKSLKSKDFLFKYFLFYNFILPTNYLIEIISINTKGITYNKLYKKIKHLFS